MAESVLSKLVKTDKETKERLVSIDNTLQKMLLNDQKMAKNEDKRFKREQQSSKRRSGDKTLTSKILGGKGKDKKEKKGFLDGLLGLFKNFGMAALVAKLGLGALIGGYIASPGFRKLVNDNILKPLGGVIKEGLIGKDGIFGKKNRDRAWKWMKENPLETLGAAATGLALLIGPKSTIGLAIKGLGIAIKGVSGVISKVMGSLITKLTGMGLLKGFSFAAAAKLGVVAGAPIALAAGLGQADKAIRNSRLGGSAGLGAEGAQLLAENDAYTSAGQGRKGAQNRQRNKGVLERKALIEEMYEVVDKYEKAKRKATKRTSNGKKSSTTIDQAALEKAKAEFEKEKADIKEKMSKLQPLKKQSGGPITVPGSSTGDKHPALLAPGSFVLNRNASGYQNGGIPAMLESGEKVYGPGQWGPREMMLNKAVPRFQWGGPVDDVLNAWGAPTPKSGLVEASHPDTGTGWSIGKDYKGRPSVFSKTAAEALLQAIKDSKGQVKTSDITSSTRSPAKNAAEGGAVNSNHLHGNAVDIHGTSKAWLKENGMKYGWKNLVYSGHDGHFDFIKGGALPVQDRDNTSSTDGKDGGGGILGNLLKLAGPMGKFFKEIMSAIGGALGDTGLFSMLFGGGGGGGPNIDGLTASSDPLTGDTQAKAKAMYDYIKAKGYSDAQAKGIVVNIQRESGFRAGVASGDDGGAGGLFQWKGSRQTPTVQELVKNKNWKGQIDYALQEDVGPQYKSATAGMNAQKAADWWMTEWERPADPVAGSAKHAAMLQGLGFQSGGVVNMRGSSSGPDISQKSENQFIDKLSSAMSPTVIPIPMGGGGGGGGGGGSHEVNRSIPSLSANPSNSVALDLAYRLSVGAAFS